MTPEQRKEIEERVAPWMELTGNYAEHWESVDGVNHLSDLQEVCEIIPALLSALDAAEARAQAAEEALKECYGCVEDGKPSHVFDVVDAYFKAQESGE